MMRSEIENPLKPSNDLDTARNLTQEIFSLHEKGADNSQQRTQLAALVGHEISKFDVDSAFGTVSANDYAEELLSRDIALPSDLTRAEMIELFERISRAKGSAMQTSFWLKLLQRNTGDNKVSDLIFWPDIYFGDSYENRELTLEEMLDAALKSGKKNQC